MVKKTSGGIGGCLKILLSALAFFLYVVLVLPDLKAYLFLTENGLEIIPMMFFSVTLLAAGLVGQMLIGLSQLCGMFRPNPLSRFAVLAMDIAMVSAGIISIPTIVGMIDEEGLILFFFAYLPPVFIAVGSGIVQLQHIRKEKEKLFAPENGLKFVRGLQLILVPVVLCCLVYVMNGMIAANIREAKAKEALRGGFNSFTMSDFNGNEYTEEMLRGHKVTMINFWATFCRPCIDEMPELDEISREYDPAVFQLVGIPTDLYTSSSLNQNKIALAENVIQATGVTYPILIPSPEIQFGVVNMAVFSVPHTIFLNEKGEQVRIVSGGRSKEEWIAIIEEVIANEA